jgi:hypothetical protein
MSGEDGDYMSPFLEENNALHYIYRDRHENDVMAAYLKACIRLGITPSFSSRR